MSIFKEPLQFTDDDEERSDFEIVNFREKVSFRSGVDRATHLLHSYPAKLLVNIPYYYLNDPAYCAPGSTVADPFCGSGTVLVEGLLRGCNVVGADTNPLARMITRAKTTFINEDRLQSSLQAIMAYAKAL